MKKISGPERGNLSNMDIGDETSFVFGRTNIVKGQTETLQEVPQSAKTIRGVKNNLLQIVAVSDSLVPIKSNSFRGQQSSYNTRELSSSGSYPGSLNDSSDAGQFAFFEKPQEITRKINKIATNGIMNNPFSEISYIDKDTTRRLKAGMSDLMKQSMLGLTSQVASTKSEELLNFNKIKV